MYDVSGEIGFKNTIDRKETAINYNRIDMFGGLSGGFEANRGMIGKQYLSYDSIMKITNDGKY